MSRYNNKFSRDTSFSTYATEDPSWTSDYLEAVNKYSVKSKKDDDQLFDQINQILGGKKSKFSSVEEAVLDMQKRTGILDLLQKKAEEKPESMLEKFPDLKEFIKKKVETFPGSAVDAIADMVLYEEKYRNHISIGGYIPAEIKNYINEIKKERENKSDDQKESSDGKIDLDIGNRNDNDPFRFLTPTSF